MSDCFEQPHALVQDSHGAVRPSHPVMNQDEHLLEAFINAANENSECIRCKFFIPMTLLGSASLLAWTDKIMQKEQKHWQAAYLVKRLS